MRTFVKIAKQQLPLIVPKHIGKLITKEPEFYPLVFYIKDVKPIRGEVGIYNGHRIVIDLAVKNDKITTTP